MDNEKPAREVMIKQLETEYSRLTSAVQALTHLSQEIASSVIGDALECPKSDSPERPVDPTQGGILPRAISHAQISGSAVEAINERIQTVLDELGRPQKTRDAQRSAQRNDGGCGCK